MRVIEAGHVYWLQDLEKDTGRKLTFIKRSSKAITHDREFDGTNSQEVIRVIIDRTKYLNDIINAVENDDTVYHLRMALLGYEARAYRRKLDKVNKGSEEHTSFRERGKDLPFTELGYKDGPDIGIENLPVGSDGHILVDQYLPAKETPEQWRTRRKHEQARQTSDS